MLLFPKLNVLIVRQRNLYYLMRRFYLIFILLQGTMFKQTSWFPFFNYISASCYHPGIIHQNLSSMLRPSYYQDIISIIVSGWQQNIISSLPLSNNANLEPKLYCKKDLLPRKPCISAESDSGDDVNHHGS